MPDTTTPTGAVFLSYSREDSEVARRLADALRAFGMEVWFDQNELRGGDAWDAKIRTQIRTCKLFVAVISAATQARGEGYFRREWKIAVERTYDMAAGVPFLVPVIIDDTTEADALVPDEFLRVQWTRLAYGVPTPAFVEQVGRLLSGKGAASGGARGSRPTNSGSPGQETRAPNKRGVPAWRWGGLTAVIVGIVTAVSVSNRNHSSAPPAPPTAAAAAAVPVVEDKSIAVLPFTNMSEDKDNAFFADGMQEDIRTNLALIRQFRVVSRTSVMAYRTTTKSLRQIASELGVAYILEGSVQRVGNKVRVAGRLIRAPTDEHVWAQAYDRDLTDVFGIQAELSQAIAAALKTALSPEEKALITRKPTDNPAAYDLYLRSREAFNRDAGTITGRAKRIKQLQAVVELDHNFAQAWTGNYAEAARLDRLQPYFDEDGTPHSQQAFQAATIYLDLGHLPAARARLDDFPSEMRLQLQREPGNLSDHVYMAGMEMVLGYADEARRFVDRAVELMPLSRDALDGATYAPYRTLIYDWTSDKEHALAEYQRLFRIPTRNSGNVHEMKVGYSTLHGDPRFEAMLADPKNHAPLF